MSDEREKRNWSEIDHARIRGIKFEKKTSKSELREQKVAASAAKKELENLFSGSKVSKEKAQRIEEIKALRGKPEFYKKMSEYFDTFGCPLEFDVQIFFLDHRDSKIVLEVLGELAKSAMKLDLSKQDMLSSKLRAMSLSTFDPKILDQIESIQKSIFRK